MNAPLLAVDALTLRHRGGAETLRQIGFELATGECLAVLGESGSGKSTLARALIGLLPPGASVSGTLRFAGELLTAKRHAQLRGRRIAMVFQDAAASLHPLRRIGVQLDEALRRAASATSVAAALREVGLDEAAGFAARYPHQLSGGQRQRVMIALALAASPQLLIADELTSALDPLAAQGVLELLDRLRRERAMALLFISHDLHAVRRVAGRVLLLHAGAVDALAAADAFFAQPPSALAQQLVAAAALRRPPAEVVAAPIVEVRGLGADYARHPALREVSFALARGAALGVVGASGSGKSTLARVLLALQRGHAQSLRIAGADPFALSASARKAWRRKVQIVFQDPGSALDPRLRVADCLSEPLALHGHGARASWPQRVRELLAAVQLAPELAQRLPHQLSGGQKQRVAIARALALDPEVLVCDEALSALDRTVQAGILDLLQQLQRERKLTLVFISHDLATVRALCDRVLVLEHGRVVEQGATAAVLADPQHPHTRALIAAAGAGAPLHCADAAAEARPS
ncbi:MAG: ABC transporter ATP-binding protein [Xanthomonadales bacterium]|nr:ABC transporter ATP-binding protein [Xanthomonadales bacterium]